jgi:hypothetical protein
MPTRIRPNRVGYSGYDCVGIPRPCIGAMDGSTNRFNCLPKIGVKIVTNAPYVDLSSISKDQDIQDAFKTNNTTHDPLLDSGVNFDLADAFERNGVDSELDAGCDYDYACGSPSGPPQEPRSKRQVNMQPGFMDPVSTDMDAIGVFITCDDTLSSSSSSLGLSSSSSSQSESSPSESSPSESEISPDLSESSGGSSESSDSESPECGTKVTVLTAVKLELNTEDNELELFYKDRDIWVNCEDPVSSWKIASELPVTDCQEE